MASFWKLITPKATTNLISNPSFETDLTGWTTGGTNTIEQVSDAQRRGVFSCKSTYADDANLASFVTTLSDGWHSAGVDVYIPSDFDGGQIVLRYIGFAEHEASLVIGADMDKLDQWQRIYTMSNIDGADPTGNLRVRTSATPTAGKFIYIDGLQVEEGETPTTYTDTTRDALDSTGGVINDLSDDLNFIVADQDGTGMPAVSNLSSPLALQPGSIFEDQTIDERHMTLTGSIVGGTPQDFHTKRRQLISALNPKTVKIDQRAEPRTFIYTGAGETKTIQAVYDGGLEKGLPQGWAEIEAGLRLKADDPLFYQLGNSAAVLDTEDTTNLSSIAVRDADGLWSNLGAGTVLDSNDIIEDDTYIYVCGQFTLFAGLANANGIARYHKQNGVWSALGTGLDNTANKMALGSDGTLYVGGNFEQAGGGSANRIATWDGAAWGTLGTGFNSVVHDIAITSAGDIVAGGEFTLADGGAANRIAIWTGAAWAALGAGSPQVVRSVAIDSSDTIHASSTFTDSWGVYSWNGATWDQLGTNFNSISYVLKFADDGTLYAGGSFVLYDGDPMNYIAKWDGAIWAEFANGLNGTCYSIEINGNLFDVGGDFTQAGEVPLADGFATWNGSLWTFPDVDLPGTARVNSTLRTSTSQFWVAHNNNGNGNIPGETDIVYTGTEVAYPIIKVSRSGGTSANLQTINNNTTGASLWFGYALEDGETLTINTRPGKQAITSSSRGNVWGSLLPNSNLGNFFLMPGNSGELANVISALVGNSGATITATLEYKTTFISED